MKQVIVVNENLKLPQGKLAAQVAHASIASFLSANAEHQQRWLEVGMPKVVLKVCNEEDLLFVKKRAADANLPVFLVKDAGKTVVKAGTTTCVGIGPANIEDIDNITGQLKLLA